MPPSTAEAEQGGIRARGSTRAIQREPNPNAIVLVLSVAGITAALMQTIVVPLIGDLPAMLDTNAANAAWVITATLLTAAVATPVSGRLGDLYGKRRMMLACAAVLAVGSVVCALAGSLIPMVVGRGLQGVGMGLIPLGISAMRDVLPAEKLGTAIALMSASMGVGGALGLPLAAGVAESMSWRVLFWGSAVLALAMIALIYALVPVTPVVAKRAGFDYIGTVGLGVGLVLLLLAVSKGGHWGWSSGLTVGLLTGSLVVLLVWGWFELRLTDPLVDLRVTARPVVLLTNLASVVIGFAMYAQALIVPQLMQLPTSTGYGLGLSMLEMGLWMMPGGLVMVLVSPLGARISHHRGPKLTLVLGGLVMAIGYGCAVLLMADPVTLMVAVGIVSGGTGLAYGAMPALIMGSVPISETASANSFNALARSVGTSVAAAVVGVVLAQMSADLNGYPIPTEEGIRVGLLIGAGVALSAALVAMMIPGRASREAEERIEHEVPVRVP